MRRIFYYAIIYTITLNNSLTLNAQKDLYSANLNIEGITVDSLYDIVNNPAWPYKEKIGVFYKCFFKRESQQEKQIAIINTLLSESKRKKDINGLLYGYSYFADFYNELNNNDLFNIYMDSADMYTEKANYSIALAAYHYSKGTQAINVPYGKKEGYKQFEIAINHYSKVIHEISYFGYILYNITIYAANQPDMTLTKRLMQNVENILQNFLNLNNQ